MKCYRGVHGYPAELDPIRTAVALSTVLQGCAPGCG